MALLFRGDAKLCFRIVAHSRAKRREDFLGALSGRANEKDVAEARLVLALCVGELMLHAIVRARGTQLLGFGPAPSAGVNVGGGASFTYARVMRKGLEPIVRRKTIPLLVRGAE